MTRQSMVVRWEEAMMMLRTIATASAIALFATTRTLAQQPAPPPTTPYGMPISIETAKRAMTAAEAEAAKNNWAMAIAIVDTGGNLVMLHRLDNTQLASIRLAEGKARTSVEFRRPTKALEDAAGSGGGVGLRYLTFGATIAEGGVPIIVDGKIIGAIGASGGASQQDAQVAKAGADAAGPAAAVGSSTPPGTGTTTPTGR
jgi:glc operon protein GlcG